MIVRTTSNVAYVPFKVLPLGGVCLANMEVQCTIGFRSHFAQLHTCLIIYLHVYVESQVNNQIYHAEITNGKISKHSFGK